MWDEKEAGFLVDTYGIEEWLGEGGQECYGNKIEFISREPIDYFNFSKIEIIKNIYENPELLGGMDMLKTLIGKRVTTFDGHSGIVIKYFKPTGRDITVHIKQDDGRIWYCPENDIIEVKE